MGSIQAPAALFYISYSPADERWAVWIAWTLESAGFRTMVQAWDFVPGIEFITFMDRGVQESTAMISVLSPSYLTSAYASMEWRAALRSSPEQPTRRLIPVRVADCPIEGLLATLPSLDLLDIQDEDVARRKLLSRVRETLDEPTVDVGSPSTPSIPPDSVERVARGRRQSAQAPDFPPTQDS